MIGAAHGFFRELRERSALLLSAVVLTMLVGTAPSAEAYTFKVVHGFQGSSGQQGKDSMAPLVMDSAGNLYGTTDQGGAHAYGVVFELIRDVSTGTWTEKVLHSFCSWNAPYPCSDGQQPRGGLIIDAAGNLYGTTFEGGARGSGVVFELMPNASTGTWTEKVLHSFCSRSITINSNLYGCTDGATPGTGLLMDGGGNIYGVTEGGGVPNSTVLGQPYGTVFELSHNLATGGWTEKVLYTFCTAQGCNIGNQTLDASTPVGGLVMDGAGNFFGTTYYGGAGDSTDCPIAGCGTVFELSPPPTGSSRWKEKSLHTFCTAANCPDGKNPDSALVLDPAGNLYSTTPSGGSNVQGVAFEMIRNPVSGAWTEKVIHSFCTVSTVTSSCADGTLPEGGLILDGSGNLFGTTILGGPSGSANFTGGGGAAFELTPNLSTGMWSETILHSFCSKLNCADGQLPEAGLFMDGLGNLFGTTSLNGSAYDNGNVFELQK